MADVAPESCLTRLMRPPIALGGSRGSAFPSILDSPCDLDSASPPRARPPLCAPHIARPPGAHLPVCARPLCTAISSLLIAISKQYPHLARARPYQVSIWPSMLPQLHLNYLVKVRRALSPSKLCLPPATLLPTTPVLSVSGTSTAPARPETCPTSSNSTLKSPRYTSPRIARSFSARTVAGRRQ